MERYQFASETDQEILKANPLAVQFVGNGDHGFINYGVLLIEAKSLGSPDDIQQIALSSLIGVQIEEFKENPDFLYGEVGVFDDNILGEYGFLLLLNEFLLDHPNYILSGFDSQ